MHEYYQKNLNKLEKAMHNYLLPIKDELETKFQLDFETLIAETWDYYKNNIVEYFPYIGGDKASGTNNLTGAYVFIALGVILRKHGASLEEWGYLTTIAYERYMNKIPSFIRKNAPRLLKHPKFIYKMLKKKDLKNEINCKENPGSFKTAVQEPNAEYQAIYFNQVCPLERFAKEHGFEEYMPYICNLDYVMFKAFNLPFYRYKTCFKGDECCDFRFKANAKINDAWPCHGLDDNDPLN